MGSITITPGLNSFVQKGDSLGYFQFGGSTVAVLFEYDRVEFDQDLVQFAKQKIETKVEMGTTLATVKRK